MEIMPLLAKAALTVRYICAVITNCCLCNNLEAIHRGWAWSAVRAAKKTLGIPECPLIIAPALILPQTVLRVMMWAGGLCLPPFTRCISPFSILFQLSDDTAPLESVPSL